MTAVFDPGNAGAADYARRRQAAQRSAYPAWLWPEVSIAAWSNAVGRLAETASAILAGRRATLEGETLATGLAAYTSGLGPLLGWWIERGELDAGPQLSSLLETHLSHSRDRSARGTESGKLVVAKLAAAGLSVAILKGGQTSHAYFPEPATRPSSDLDLLVPAADARRAESALRAAGFVERSRGARESCWGQATRPVVPASVWMVDRDDPWTVDLHWSLDFRPDPGARLVHLDKAKPLDAVEFWTVDRRAKALPQPLLLLHLAVHAGGGLHSLTLLRMVELILVIRKDSAEGRLSWAAFLALGEATGGLGAAYPALALADQLAPGTVPAEILERLGSAAPKRVRTFVGRLSPATAHRVERTSLREHFMWPSGPSGWMRLLASDLTPRAGGFGRSLAIYRRRVTRLIGGGISR